MTEYCGQTGVEVRPARRHYRFALVSVACLLIAIFVPSRCLSMAFEGHWFVRAVANGVFVKYSAVALFSGISMAVCGVILWDAGRPQRGRASGEQGGAMIEFALVMPIALMLCLILAQASLLMVGHLCVNYAAYCSARSAIVMIPDSSTDEDANYLQWRHSSYDRGKASRIGKAAIWAVLPISCSARAQAAATNSSLDIGLEDLFEEFGAVPPTWISTHLLRKLAYARANTSVVVDAPSGGEFYESNEDIRVVVSHRFYLAIPYAGALLARADEDGVELNIGSGEYGIEMRAECTLTNEGVQDYIEMEQFATGS